MQVPTSSVPASAVPSLSLVTAHLIVLSVALERVIEILKGFIPVWPFAGARSKLRSAVLTVIIAAFGAAFCWKFHLNLLHVEHVRSGYIAAGLAAAAGAAFWNNLLGLMKAARHQKESQAVADI